ncbi:hypothetical protein TNCV_2003421 [Trichonephila clavipes]|nr:hypothetical protein TNCV_2003421 [Trichonephila clavipes]
MFQCNQQSAYSPRHISQLRSFHSNNQSEIFSNVENRRNCSCNHASLLHPLNQSGDFYPSRPNHIKPHLTFSIWDGGMLCVPFPSDKKRPETKTETFMGFICYKTQH